MPTAGSHLHFFAARAVAVVTLIACTGCWTPALWPGGGGTRVEVVEVIGAVTDGQTGRPALVLECEGEGLARGKWYAVVPLEEGGALDASLDERWGGMTLGDFRGLARAPGTRARADAADNADSLRRRLRVSRKMPPDDVVEIDARILPHGPDHVLVAYWPPGERAEVPMVVRARWLDEEAARAFIQKLFGDDRAWREYEAHANLVEVVHRPDWSQARPAHIALLPRTLLRPLPQRIGATSAALALTPLALAGDAVGLALGVVTAPIWIPAFYLTMWLNPPFSLDRPPPEPEWHAPKSLPPE